MPCLGGRDVDAAEMGNPNLNLTPKNKSQESLTSQESVASLMSQSSLHSEYSLQSELSIGSYNSLASVPSLGIAQAPLDGEGVHYRCIATLQGHTGHVFSLAMAGNDIRAWKHCEGSVKSIMVAGDWIYSAHQDHRIRVWRRSKQQLVATMPTVKDYLMTFMLPKNYVQVRRHRKALWIQHVDTISALSVDAKGFLYSGSWDRTVKIWRPSDFRCVESFRAHDDAINALVLSSDGFLYTGSADARIKVWAKAEGEKKHSLLATLERHKSAINALALAGSILYSGACDRSIVVWAREESAHHMTVAGALRGHTRAILCLATVADLLCSGSADKSVRLWRRGEGNSHSCLGVLDGHGGPVKSIAASLDAAAMGCLVYSGSLDHDIKVWRVSNNPDDHSPPYSDVAAPPFLVVF